MLHIFTSFVTSSSLRQVVSKFSFFKKMCCCDSLHDGYCPFFSMTPSHDLIWEKIWHSEEEPLLYQGWDLLSCSWLMGAPVSDKAELRKPKRGCIINERIPQIRGSLLLSLLLHQWPPLSIPQSHKHLPPARCFENIMPIPPDFSEFRIVAPILHTEGSGTQVRLSGISSNPRHGERSLCLFALRKGLLAGTMDLQKSIRSRLESRFDGRPLQRDFTSCPQAWVRGVLGTPRPPADGRGPRLLPKTLANQQYFS